VRDQSRDVPQLLENNSQSLHVKLIEKQQHFRDLPWKER